MAYGLGLLPFIFIKVLAPGYFARQDTRTPVKIGIIAMATNMVLNIILMIQYAHVGLALATSISAVLNAGLLYAGLRKIGVYQPDAGWGLFMLKLLIPNSALLLLLVLFTPEITEWVNGSVWQRVTMLFSLIAGAMALYFSMLSIVGIKLKALLKPRTS